MATTVNEPTFIERRMGERRRYPPGTGGWAGNAFRVSWAGIWAGVLASLGSLLLLTALGFAVGASATGNADTGALGLGAAIWAGLSLLIALFIGGMLSTRLAMITDRSTGMYEGALVWVLSTILILYLAGSGVSMLASGAFSLMGGAGRSVATLASITDMDVSPQNIDQVIARLRDPGTARQIATATGLPMNEVQGTLSRTADAVQSARADPARAAAEVRSGLGDLMARAQPVERAGRTAAWVSFFALLLSLGTAIGGAVVGRRQALAHRPQSSTATTSTT